MRTAMIEQPGDIQVGSVEHPTPSSAEIVVQVGGCGICGTDLHIADGEFPTTSYQVVPDHEVLDALLSKGVALDDSLDVSSAVQEGQESRSRCYRVGRVLVPGSQHPDLRR